MPNHVDLVSTHKYFTENESNDCSKLVRYDDVNCCVNNQ